MYVIFFCYRFEETENLAEEKRAEALCAEEHAFAWTQCLCHKERSILRAQ